ncbi:hypothetical protein BJX64DRAFT_291262 [Aspergillus heterothallicus]
MQEVEAVYKQAISGHEALGPGEMAPVLEARKSLGHLHNRCRIMDKAEDMYNRVRSGYHELYGPDHTLTLDSLDNLGMVYVYHGVFDVAESMCRTAFEGKMSTLGTEHLLTLNSMENMARINKAEETLKRSLAIEKILGPYHPSTMHKVFNLGFVYMKHAKFEGSGAMIEQAIAGYPKTLGPHDEYTLCNGRTYRASVPGG